MNDNPDKIVAKAIKEEFEEKRIIRNSDLKTINDKLASGSINAEDWLLMAELSLENQKR